jgi:hypothetical protein
MRSELLVLQEKLGHFPLLSFLIFNIIRPPKSKAPIGFIIFVLPSKTSHTFIFFCLPA